MAGAADADLDELYAASLPIGEAPVAGEASRLDDWEADDVDAALARFEALRPGRR